MLGAIFGDIVGSSYEWNNVKTKDFLLERPGTRYTDDNVMTLAIGKHRKPKNNEISLQGMQL